jgi:hypothetical protein
VITRRRFAAVLLVFFLLAPLPARAAEWLIAFQAVPDSADAVYNQRAALTAGVVAELGPPVMSAVGLDPATFDADIVIGGYRGRTSPSVVLHVDGDVATADRATAGFGFAFDQAEVLVWNEAASGDTLAVSIAFPSLTPTLADFFFRNAMAVNLGLAGGYTVLDNRLIFINLRGADGQPFSKLDDQQFAAALHQAAKAFGNIAVVTTEQVNAHLIGRDAYAAALGPEQTAALEKLRARHAALVAAPR